jgi:hypothetical protein
MSRMKPVTALATQEALAGLVERVTFRNAENGFCVLRTKARGHRDLVTVVGHSATIAAGEWITAMGEWFNDRNHGQQFKARFLRTFGLRSARRLAPDDAGFPPGKGSAKLETATVFWATNAYFGRQRLAALASPAPKPRKVEDYSDRARKPSLRGTGWWGW